MLGRDIWKSSRSTPCSRHGLLWVTCSNVWSSLQAEQHISLSVYSSIKYCIACHLAGHPLGSFQYATLFLVLENPKLETTFQMQLRKYWIISFYLLGSFLMIQPSPWLTFFATRHTNELHSCLPWPTDLFL